MGRINQLASSRRRARVLVIHFYIRRNCFRRINRGHGNWEGLISLFLSNRTKQDGQSSRRRHVLAWRIDMEDKISTQVSNNTIELFGVFDGHGDGGHASKNYIASTNIWTKLQTQKDWMTAVTMNKLRLLHFNNIIMMILELPTCSLWHLHWHVMN